MCTMYHGITHRARHNKPVMPLLCGITRGGVDVVNVGRATDWPESVHAGECVEMMACRPPYGGHMLYKW